MRVQLSHWLKRCGLIGEAGSPQKPSLSDNQTTHEAFIKLAYKGLLRREADADGLRHYNELLNCGAIDYTALLDVLINSDEFNNTYSIYKDPQYNAFITDNIMKTSALLSNSSRFTLCDIDAAVPGLKGLEYYEYHKPRFLEMINGIDFVQTMIGPNINLLECGSIFTTKIIHEIFPLINISTLDNVEIDQIGYGDVYRIKDFVKRHYKRDLVRDHIDSILLEETPTFDMILFCEVIEHLVVNPHRILKFLLRQLKPGGYIYLTTPNVFKKANIESISKRVNPFLLYPENYSFDDIFMFHVREYCMGELLNIISASGGSISGFYFSACWDDPTLVGSMSAHDLGNLVILIKKEAL
jgi:SAM-dependent methyltransferase